MSDARSPAADTPSVDSIGDAVMFYQGEEPHPAHRAFANSISADLRHFETGEPPSQGSTQAGTQDTHSLADRVQTGSKRFDYDIVIAEGTAPLQTLLTYKTLNPSATAIYLAADETFHTLSERPTRHLWTVLGPLANRLLDGVVAVGQDVYDWSTPYIGEVPVEIVHPPISDSKYDLLANLSPTAPQSPFQILTVGDAQMSKNHHLIADAVTNLRSRYGDHIEAVFLGKDHQQQPYADREGIRTPGFVPLDEFKHWHHSASVYVQSSIGDSFPVASLEAMLAGTPTIVTESVGTRHLLPDDHMIPVDVESLTTAISRVHDLTPDERRELGIAHRGQVVGITESAQKQQFRTAVAELVHS